MEFDSSICWTLPDAVHDDGGPRGVVGASIAEI
jgi:hypothetical protein